MSELIQDGLRHQQLRTQADFFTDLFESIEDIVVIFDLEGKPIYWNDRLGEITGFSADEITSQRPSEFVADVDDQQFRDDLRTVVNQGEVTRTYDLRTQSGEQIAFEFTATVISNSDSQPIGVCMIGRNVQEREQRELFLESLLETGHQLFAVDSAAEILSAITTSVTELLPDSEIRLYLADDGTVTSVLSARHAAATNGSRPTAFDGNTHVTRAYRTGERQQCSRVADIDDAINREEIITSVFHPLPSQGVIEIGLSRSEGLTKSERIFCELLTEIVTAALDQLDQQAELRNQKNMLTTLHDTSEEIFQATSAEGVCDVVIDAADTILDLPASGMFLWNDDEQVLEPMAVTDAAIEQFGTIPHFGPGEGLVWQTFLEGETTCYRNVPDHQQIYNDDTQIQEELIVPIDQYGVFVSGAVTHNAFSATDVEFTDILLDKALAAFTRLDQEESIDTHKSQLQKTSEQLETTTSLISLLRETHVDIVTSDSSGQIEKNLCDQLVEYDPIGFAWIGSVTDDSNAIESVRYTTGSTQFATQLAEATIEERPATRSLETEAPVSVVNILHSNEFQPWQTCALESGYQSCYSFPIRYNDIVHGVLEVYGGKRDSLGSNETSIIEELAASTGNKINAIKQREALASRHSTEITLCITDVDEPVNRIATEMEAEIRIDGLVPTEDQSWIAYGVSDCAFEELTAAVSNVLGVGAVDSVGTDEKDVRLELQQFEMVDLLIDRSVNIETMVVAGDQISVTVTLPPTVSVQNVMNRCEQVYESVELVHRTVVRETSPSEYRQQIREELTEKQIETVQQAYVEGYFDWPREITAEELADDMAVTPPTVHQHLRKGLDTVVELIFDEHEQNSEADR